MARILIEGDSTPGLFINTAVPLLVPLLAANPSCPCIHILNSYPELVTLQMIISRMCRMMIGLRD